jgi:hypothetical protein
MGRTWLAGTPRHTTAGWQFLLLQKCICCFFDFVFSFQSEESAQGLSNARHDLTPLSHAPIPFVFEIGLPNFGWDDLELEILSSSWYYRCVPPCLAF